MVRDARASTRPSHSGGARTFHNIHQVLFQVVNRQRIDKASGLPTGAHTVR
jgi:hypothetical protein